MSTGAPLNPDGAQAAEQSTTPQQETDGSWEGDKMFNIYIFDYCNKRGYKDTALALKREANVPEDSHPPINAKQGLLFEWWSVFWVLFTAKSSGAGSDDAMVYTQFQNERRQQQEAGRNPVQNRPTQPQPTAQTRLVNGMRINGQPGPLPNGAHPGSAMPGGQPPMTNGITNVYPGAMTQPNGLLNAQNGPAVGTPQQPLIPGQPRPGVPPQRNGVPFRSPTIANSPQNPGPQQPGQPPNAMGVPPSQMPQRAMGPPNGQPGLPGAPPMHPGPFPSLPSTPSQPNSPASHGMTAPSPSMTNRQIPGRAPGDAAGMPQQEMTNQELFRIESSKLPELKQELGLAHRDIPSLTVEEKSRIVGLAKARGLLPVKPGAPSTASPSNAPQQPPHVGRPMAQPLTAVAQIQRAAKRSSTSPEEDGESSQQGDTSPANKRLRKSPPGDQSSQPPMTPMVPFTQGGVSGPPHGPAGSGMIPRGMPLPFAGVQNAPGMPGMPMGPMIGPHTVTPQMAQPHFQYRQTMQALHKPPGMPGGPGGSPAAGADSPYGGDVQQRPGPGQFSVPGPVHNRPGMPPQMKGMPPPPSPGMNPGKPGGLPPKNEPGIGINSSPRNAAAVPGQPGQQQLQQPPPPGPMPPGANTHVGGNTAPPTPGGPPSNMATPSLSTNLPMAQGPPSGAQSQPPQPSSNDMFGPDMMQFDLDQGLFSSSDFNALDVGFGEGFEWLDASLMNNGDPQ